MFHTVRFVPKFIKMESDSIGNHGASSQNGIKNSLFTKFIIDCLEIINQKFSKIPIEFKQDENFCVVTETDLLPQRDYIVDVYLYDNNSTARYFGMEEDDWSFHAVKSGFFKDIDRSDFSSKHRIFFKVNTEEVIDYFTEERKNEIDPSSNIHDEEYLISLLFHLYKECMYSFEYIENANGLTPSRVYNLDIDPYDFSYGIGCYFEIDAAIRNHSEERLISLKNDLLYDLMDERVSNKAKFISRSSNEIYKLKSYNDVLKWIDREMSQIYNSKRHKLFNLFKLPGESGLKFKISNKDIREIMPLNRPILNKEE